VGDQDLLDERQPDALAVGLGAEERREQPRRDVGRDAAAAVFDPQCGHAVLARERDRDVAVLADRVDGVAHDVDERLLHLAAVHAHLSHAVLDL
jgi:hypothetical protein